MSAALALPEVTETYVAPKPAPPLTDTVVLYGTAFLLGLCPLAFGAVEPWAIFVLESVTAILFLIWLVGQMRSSKLTVVWTPVFPPMLAFAGIMLVQLLPGVSAYRYATYSRLLLYVSYGLCGFLITQTFTRTRQLRVLATALGIYGVAVAIFAILQSLSSTGKLYWLRTPRFGGWIYGPYVNHNHYAGLMEMLVPVPLIFSFSRYAHGRERWIGASAAALMAATIFLSGSRGGMVAFVAQMAIFGWLFFREGRQRSLAFLLVAFLLIALTMVAWTGGSEVSARLFSATTDRHVEIASDTRLRIDRDAMRMFAKRPLLGWGMGTFENVYPQFRSFYTNFLVDKAHNDYLQLLAETGIVGFACGIWFLAASLRSAWRTLHKWTSDINSAVAAVAILGIAGILVHSLVDFNLQIPANALLFYSLCAVATMGPRFTNHRGDRRHRQSATSDPLSESSILGMNVKEEFATISPSK
jgi:O-antigen ligase